MKQKAENWVEQLMARGFDLPAPPAPDWQQHAAGESWTIEELDFEQLDQLAAAGTKPMNGLPHFMDSLSKSK